MEENYIINILDTHENNGEKSQAELNTVGRFSVTDYGFSMSYREQDDTLKSCVTTLDIFGPDKVIMSRTGDYTTEMVLENKKRNSCYYSTPMGDLFMGVYTKKIDHDLTADGGTLELNYTIDFNAGILYENSLSISVKRAQ
ncbi:MAG: DUF1934 domain-containing protein [Clostridiales bacterium]|nr:DUF1934 domain-containing protein [Clostridiales bacterium]